MLTDMKIYFKADYEDMILEFTAPPEWFPKLHAALGNSRELFGDSDEAWISGEWMFDGEYYLLYIQQERGLVMIHHGVRYDGLDYTKLDTDPDHYWADFIPALRRLEKIMH